MLRDEDGGYYIGELSKINLSYVLRVEGIDEEPRKERISFGVVFCDSNYITIQKFGYKHFYQAVHDFEVIKANVADAQRYDPKTTNICWYMSTHEKDKNDINCITRNLYKL